MFALLIDETLGEDLARYGIEVAANVLERVGEMVDQHLQDADRGAEAARGKVTSTACLVHEMLER